MIPYEELCAALEAYVARNRGEALPAGGDTMHGQYDPPPLDNDLPAEEPRAVLSSQGGEEDATHAGMSPVYEDRSNELDLGDIDEDIS